jgi:ubiquinol-cytochrome c reductase cytochrome b subunit
VVSPDRRSILKWLDSRTGYRRIRDYVFDEPLPPGTGWWFTLGSVLLFGLAVQVVTGIALAIYYAPTPDHAWDSVRFISTTVRAGSLLRGLHHWGASVVVVAAVLHLLRVVAFGSYRAPREMNWIVGIALLVVIFAFGLTGYLLPWDQRAYWATVVTINVSKLAPGIGAWTATLLQGGSEIGALTLTRWYAAHVLVLPLVLATLTAGHLYLMRRHGISGPIVPDATRPRQRFFPHQAARDLTMAVVVGAILVGLAWRGAPALERPADPSSSDYVPRPEWYFLGLFQLLKYFPGRLELIGALVVPALAVTGLVLLPWIDRGRSRSWKDRRAVLGATAVALSIVVALTVLGARDRPSERADVWTLRELAGASLISTGDRCRRCHSDSGIAPALEAGRIGGAKSWVAMHTADPEVVGPGVREPPAPGEFDEQDQLAMLAALAHLRSDPPPAMNADARSLAVLMNRQCLKCHVIDGMGGTEGPDLSHAGAKLAADAIARRVTNPKAVKADSEMPEFSSKLSPSEIQAIASWLARRK